jgi:hypothetical protein
VLLHGHHRNIDVFGEALDDTRIYANCGGAKLFTISRQDNGRERLGLGNARPASEVGHRRTERVAFW